MLDLLSVMILKIASESIFFKTNKFTACKIKHDKFFDAAQSTEDYSSISRQELFKYQANLKVQPTKACNGLLRGSNTDASL